MLCRNVCRAVIWEKKLGFFCLFFVHIHTNLPYILIWRHWYLLLFLLSCILPCVYTVTTIMFISPLFIIFFISLLFVLLFFLVNVLIVESVNDPYWLLLWVNPVTPPPRFWVAHTWINKGCWLSCVVGTVDYNDGTTWFGYSSFHRLVLQAPISISCPIAEGRRSLAITDVRFRVVSTRCHHLPNNLYVRGTSGALKIGTTM